MMTKQTEYAERLKQFNKARIEFDHGVKAVADKFGYSKRRIYDVLKYPNENPDLYKQVHQYVNSAGYLFPEDKKKVAIANA